MNNKINYKIITLIKQYETDEKRVKDFYLCKGARRGEGFSPPETETIVVENGVIFEIRIKC